MDPNILSEQIDEFFNKGANGFLVWQYSGYYDDQKGRRFASDPYSFYRDLDGDTICPVLKEKADSNPNKFIGVNIWNLGALEFSPETIKEHLTWLNTNCGTTVVRIFAKADRTPGVMNALNAANGTGVKIIVSIGDYSNGNWIMPQGAGADWYQNGYTGEFQSYSQELASAVSGHQSLYGLELANEPHCGGLSDEVIGYYTNWGRNIGAILKRATNNVGYGQMSNPNGVCDDPYTGGFRATNNINEITMTSAHYYNEEHRQSALKALEESKSLEGGPKMFYIGEAGWDNSIDDNTSGTPRDRDDYFIYPINLNPDSDWTTGTTPLDPDNTNKVLWNLAYDQGYQVSCPSKKVTIKKNVLDAINRYFELYDDEVLLQSSSGLKANANEAKIPLYRGNEVVEETQKTSSLEGYFGAMNLEQENPMVGSGVANNLLSLKQQCQIKHDNAMVTNELCQKLEDPGACALDKKIPNSELTPSGLFWAMDKYLHKQSQDSSPKTSTGISCDDWVLTWNDFQKNRPTAANKIGQKKFEDVQTAIQNMSIIPENSYRMAYIVITPLQNSKSLDADPFWFLASEKDSFNHAPIFIGIKIPDTLTNRAYSASFSDAAMITSNALKQNTNIEEEYNNEVGRRQGTLNNISTAQKIRIDNLNKPTTEQTKQIINCGDMPRCTQGSEEIPLYLREALLDLINGEGNACDGGGGIVEDAGDIFSYAEATKKEGSRTFTGDFLDGIIPSGNSQIFSWGLKISSADQARSPFTNPANNPESANSIPVMVHFVAPLGSNLQDIQEGLWALFDSQTKDIISPESPDYYPIKDLAFGFSDDVTKKFWDPNIDCGESIDPITGLPVSLAPCDNNDFTIELTDKESNGGINFPGARLGWMVKKIQESFNAISTSAYEYVISCKTTEDMFLGRCDGGSLFSDSGSLGQDPTNSGGWGPKRCAPITNPSNPCDVDGELMKKYFPDPIQRKNASIICRAESGGDPTSLNTSCTSVNPSDSTGDYSIGLFQVNLAVADNRCPGAMSKFVDENSLLCTVANQSKLDSCREQLLIPENNIKWAAENSGHGKYWGAWPTSKPEYCGNYITKF